MTGFVRVEKKVSENPKEIAYNAYFVYDAKQDEPPLKLCFAFARAELEGEDRYILRHSSLEPHVLVELMYLLNHVPIWQFVRGGIFGICKAGTPELFEIVEKKLHKKLEECLKASDLEIQGVEIHWPDK